MNRILTIATVAAFMATAALALDFMMPKFSDDGWRYLLDEDEFTGNKGLMFAKESRDGMSGLSMQCFTHSARSVVFHVHRNEPVLALPSLREPDVAFRVDRKPFTPTNYRVNGNSIIISNPDLWVGPLAELERQSNAEWVGVRITDGPDVDTAIVDLAGLWDAYQAFQERCNTLGAQ